MTIKLMLMIIGTLGILFFWLLFRGCIKEGSIKTEIPFIFLLDNQYKDERKNN